MKTADANIERKLLLTVLQHEDDRVRNYILANCAPDDFGTEAGNEARTRMAVLLRAGKDFGDAAIFRGDPTLSEGTVEFLKCSKPTRKKAAKLPLRSVKKMIQVVHDYRKIRTLYENAKVITELCTQQYTETTIQEAEVAMMDAVKALRETRGKKVIHFGRNRTEDEAKQWLRGMMRKQENRFIPTGLPHLDQHMTGWRRGDLVVISAPRGGGKTALILQTMVSQFRAGYNVGLASMEMDEEQLVERLIANVTDTKFSSVRKREYGDKEERKRIWQQWKRFEFDTAQKHGNFFSPWELKAANYTPESLELDMGPFGYDIIYIDYLSLFSSGRKETWQAQKEHGRYLKQLAGRMDPKCVIVLLTQLSKDERVKYGTGPEEDADYWMWWRYGNEEKETGRVELILDKARHTRTGVIPAKFDLAKMQIKTTGPIQTGMSNYLDNQKKRQNKNQKASKRMDFDNPLLDADLDGDAVERGY